MVSPIFFSVYLDDLFKELHDLGVECHMGGAFVGDAGYADDVVLLAPTRSTMAARLVCAFTIIVIVRLYLPDEVRHKSILGISLACVVPIVRQVMAGNQI